MRYYAIKISAGSSTGNAGNTSGSAGLPVASNGRVAGPVLAQLAAAKKKRLGFRVVDPNDIPPLPSQRDYVAANPQPFIYGGMDPEIVARSNPDFHQPNVPATVQPPSTTVAAPVGGSGVATTTASGTGTGSTSGTSGTGTGASSATQGSQGAQFISVVNGQNDPGALDIEFDISLPIGDSGAPNTGWLKIRGIPFSMVTQSSQFNHCKLQMWAGYTNGLPLANLQVPHQGLILDGEIFPALGNWIYNDLSLEFFVVPGSAGGVGGPTNPKNIVHNVPANQPFATAIKNTLQTAFPQSTINVDISQNIKLAYNDYGFYQSIEQYSSYLKSLSHDLLGTPQSTGYQGVRIYTQGNTISVKDDSTGAGGPIALQYTDFVGQPTWISANKISIKTLLRGDISPPSGGTVQVTLPANTLATVSSPDQAKIGQNNNILTFQGSWTVTAVRHIGKFRSPTMDSWVTIIEAVPGSGGGGGTNTSDAPGGPANDSGNQTFNPPSGAAPGSSGGIGRA
jgi:hypothetical protein